MRHHLAALGELERERQRFAADLLQPHRDLQHVLEADGPPGTTAIDVVAGPDAGLRTFRLQVARVARLAGFLVVNASSGAAPWRTSPARHLCALDWLPCGRVLPPVIADAAAAGGRRHVWIRFCRHVPGATSVDVAPPFLRLEPMMRDELTAAIFPRARSRAS